MAVSQTEFRQDDLEFTLAARHWSHIVQHGDFEMYRKEFEKTQAFFSPMFPEANRRGNEMIKLILSRDRMQAEDSGKSDSTS